MSVALPIQLVTGDICRVPCLITGEPIIKATFSIVVDLADGYTFSNGTITGPSSYSYTFTGDVRGSGIEGTNKIIVNVDVNSPTPAESSHDITFIIPASLTESFKGGKYSYDISVKLDVNSRYTPIYTNAFNVFPRTNKIIP